MSEIKEKLGMLDIRKGEDQRLVDKTLYRFVYLRTLASISDVGISLVILLAVAEIPIEWIASFGCYVGTKAVAAGARIARRCLLAFRRA